MAVLSRCRPGSRRISVPGDHTEQSGIEPGRLLLDERDGGRPLPTAVLAGNDRCAMGLLMTLTQAGVDVPRDLSVVGYDDSHLSHLMPIGLTTVRQDAVLMAEYAVRFAVERLEGTAPEPREAVLDPMLTVRGTSGPPPESVGAGHRWVLESRRVAVIHGGPGSKGPSSTRSGGRSRGLQSFSKGSCAASSLSTRAWSTRLTICPASCRSRITLARVKADVTR